FVDIAEKVRHGVRRLGLIQFQHDLAQAGVQLDPGSGVGQCRQGQGKQGSNQPAHDQPSRISADSISTVSFGTSRWKPLVPVGTALIMLSTSMPSTTLPNTA